MRYVRDRLQDMENPWTEVLAELVNREEPPPPPRQLAPWQLYMSKKKPEIDAELEERRAAEDTPRERVLALRSLIARELLAEETEEYRAALQTECEEIRDADVAMEQQEPVRTRPTEAAQTQCVSSTYPRYIVTNATSAPETSLQRWCSRCCSSSESTPGCTSRFWRVPRSPAGTS